MQTSQNVTDSENQTPAQSSGVTDPRHQALIDYRAVNGTITDDNGTHKMTVEELATTLGVDRRQLYRWQETIPDFWGKVNARRKELFPRSRLARIHDVWYISALLPGAKGFRDRQLWLANYDDNFRMPTEKVQHELGDGVADALNIARERRMKVQTVIDGEVVDDNANAN
jgi:hypothetical protein